MDAHWDVKDANWGINPTTDYYARLNKHRTNQLTSEACYFCLEPFTSGLKYNGRKVAAHRSLNNSNLSLHPMHADCAKANSLYHLILGACSKKNQFKCGCCQAEISNTSLLSGHEVAAIYAATSPYIVENLQRNRKGSWPKDEHIYARLNKKRRQQLIDEVCSLCDKKLVPKGDFKGRHLVAHRSRRHPDTFSHPAHEDCAQGVALFHFFTETWGIPLNEVHLKCKLCQKAISNISFLSEVEIETIKIAISNYKEQVANQAQNEDSDSEDFRNLSSCPNPVFFVAMLVIFVAYESFSRCGLFRGLA